MKSLIYIAIAVFVTLTVGGAWAQQAKGTATAEQIKQELINLQQQVNRLNDRYKATLWDAEQQADRERTAALAPIQRRAQELQAQLKELQAKNVPAKLKPLEPPSPVINPGGLKDEDCQGEDCK